MLYWASAHYVIHLRSHCHKPGNKADSQSCCDRVHNITAWPQSTLQRCPSISMHPYRPQLHSGQRQGQPFLSTHAVVSCGQTPLKAVSWKWQSKGEPSKYTPQPPELPSWSNCPKLYFWNCFVKPKLHTVDPSSFEITIILWGLL